MAADKMMLTDAYSKLVNFLAMFEGIAELRDAAETVLRIVDNPQGLEYQAKQLEAQVEALKTQVAEQLAKSQQAEADHRAAMLRREQEAGLQQDEIARRARALHKRLTDETQAIAAEETTKQGQIRASIAEELQRLNEQIVTKRGELDDVITKLRQANAQLEALQQLVGRK